MAWNFGDILDAISPVLPQDAPALVHGDRRITWGEMTKRSNNLARALIERGHDPDELIERNLKVYLEEEERIQAVRAKRAREDGQDVTGQGYYTVCDLAMLHALLQRHMWGMHR